MSEDHKKIADTDLENVAGGQDASANPANLSRGEVSVPDPAPAPGSTLDPNEVGKGK